MDDSDRQSNDIRHQLRADHERALAELVSLRLDPDERGVLARLRELRRAWMIHELAEETVVYRALDQAEASVHSRKRTDERFMEHELVGGLFGRLAHIRPGTPEWHARLDAVRDQLARHVAIEETDMFARLARHFDAEALRAMGERFRSAQRKLTLLEQAKAA